MRWWLVVLVAFLGLLVGCGEGSGGGDGFDPEEGVGFAYDRTCDDPYDCEWVSGYVDGGLGCTFVTDSAVMRCGPLCTAPGDEGPEDPVTCPMGYMCRGAQPFGPNEASSEVNVQAYRDEESPWYELRGICSRIEPRPDDIGVTDPPPVGGNNPGTETVYTP